MSHRFCTFIRFFWIQQPFPKLCARSGVLLDCSCPVTFKLFLTESIYRLHDLPRPLPTFASVAIYLENATHRHYVNYSIDFKQQFHITFFRDYFDAAVQEQLHDFILPRSRMLIFEVYMEM